MEVSKSFPLLQFVIQSSHHFLRGNSHAAHKVDVAIRILWCLDL